MIIDGPTAVLELNCGSGSSRWMAMTPSNNETLVCVHVYVCVCMCVYICTCAFMCQWAYLNKFAFMYISVVCRVFLYCNIHAHCKCLNRVNSCGNVCVCCTPLLCMFLST